MSGEHHRPALSPEGQRDKEHSKACLFYLRFQPIRQRDFPSGRPVAQGTNQAGGTACAADSASSLCSQFRFGCAWGALLPQAFVHMTASRGQAFLMLASGRKFAANSPRRRTEQGATCAGRLVMILTQMDHCESWTVIHGMVCVLSWALAALIGCYR